MKVLHIDQNHPSLIEKLEKNKISSDVDLLSSKEELEKIIPNYEGLVLRSRIVVDEKFIKKASKLKFIARVGSGLEHIDSNYARLRGIEVLSSPEGNADSVGEHAIGMLLSLFKNMSFISSEIQKGLWPRAEVQNRELMGKTLSIIGYGHTGRAFAKRLSGFSLSEVLFYDLMDKPSDEYARKATLEEIFEKSDICSLHVWASRENNYLINKKFIERFARPIYLINTARGECLHLRDHIEAIKEKKVLGAALDVLEYEHSSFKNLQKEDLEVMNYLRNSKQVLLSSHVAGLSRESFFRLSNSIAQKIINFVNEK